MSDTLGTLLGTLGYPFKNDGDIVELFQEDTTPCPNYPKSKP